MAPLQSCVHASRDYGTRGITSKVSHTAAVTSVERNVLRLTTDGSENAIDRLAAESPVELRLGSTPIAVLMRTPGLEQELLRGFALTEGIVLDPREIGSMEQVGPDRWALVPALGVEIDPEQFRRNLYSTSSCGVCGKASIDAVRITARTLPSGPVVTRSTLLNMGLRLRQSQPTFDDTGGLHAAGLFEPTGRLLASAEDIGRHNAVDKVIGSVAPYRWPVGETVLVVSGRVSFEVAQKAAVAGIPMVAGVSAASTLAVELADELELTVIGFLRDEGCVVYSGAHRIARGE